MKEDRSREGVSRKGAKAQRELPQRTQRAQSDSKQDEPSSLFFVYFVFLVVNFLLPFAP
jgi:hypothetical protein